MSKYEVSRLVHISVEPYWSERRTYCGLDRYCGATQYHYIQLNNREHWCPECLENPNLALIKLADMEL